MNQCLAEPLPHRGIRDKVGATDSPEAEGIMGDSRCDRRTWLQGAFDGSVMDW